jgi:hypothetical protein
MLTWPTAVPESLAIAWRSTPAIGSTALSKG